MIWNNQEIIKVVKGAGIIVMPTDTIYGILGKATDEAVVTRIYAARKRNPEKPCIILIGDVGVIERFSITLTDAQKNVIKNIQEPTSFILDCEDDAFTYLHRGTKTLAFRLPLQEELRKLLLETGPLIAPSANLEGLPPATTIAEARKYFGDSVELYADGGVISGKASKVIKLHKDGSIDILRG